MSAKIFLGGACEAGFLGQIRRSLRFRRFAALAALAALAVKLTRSPNSKSNFLTAI
jgi:hypothetical protein